MCIPYMTNIWCMVPETSSVRDKFFWSIWTIFYPFTPLTTQKIKLLKHWKNICRYYHFTHVYYKWQSYDAKFFVILDRFLPFYSPSLPPNNLKNQNFEKMKKMLELSLFYTSVPKIMIKCYTVPEIWHMTDIMVIFHFGLFFALLPT